MTWWVEAAEDIHPVDTVEALDIVAVQEPQVPLTVPVLVMAPIVAPAIRGTHPLPGNQASTGGTFGGTL